MMPDPKQRTSAQARTQDGVVFYCYRAGLRYEWWSDDGRCAIHRPHYAETFRVRVDGVPLTGRTNKPRYFRTFDAALAAAVNTARRGVDHGRHH